MKNEKRIIQTKIRILTNADFCLVGAGGFVTTHQAASGLACEGNTPCDKEVPQRPSRSGSSCHPVSPTKKALLTKYLFCWWERVDSDHRSQ